MSEQTLRILGVGAGYFAQFHYDSWKRMERVELVAYFLNFIHHPKTSNLLAISYLQSYKIILRNVLVFFW